MNDDRRDKVLFVAESVTLAHVGRLAALATAVDTQRYTTHFAQCPRYRPLLGPLPVTEHAIDSITPELFSARLAQGEPLYDLKTLRDYLRADRALIQALQPEVVVSDFRLTLPLAAQLEGVPCITISNACWSPFVKQRHLVPDLPLSRLLGPRLGQAVFSIARPFAFALHCVAMRSLYRESGLQPPGFNLGRVYSAGDAVAYADLPTLYNMRAMPDNHRFIGPIVWSPVQPLPQWWNQLPEGRPVVYLTLGSSGNASLLPLLLQGLAALDVTVIVSTAGAQVRWPDQAGVFAADYLPGEKAAGRAALVICNGGSPTTQQALQCGVPVLGIAGNMDQHLNMQTLEEAGAGLRLRSDSVTATAVAAAAGRLLQEPGFKQAAARLSGAIAQFSATERFGALLEETVASYPRGGDARTETAHA